MQTTVASPQAMAMYGQAFGTAQAAAARPFTPYSSDPNAFVAPINQQQQMAIGNINQVAQTGQPYFQAGAGLTGAAGTTFAPQIVGNYMNPYTQAVAAPTLELLRQQQGRELAQQQAQAIKAGAFGGDRAGIERAVLQGQQGLAYGKTAGDIFSAGYAPAMGAAQADLQRQLQAGGQFGQLGQGASQSAIAGTQAQLGAGTLQQQTQQAGLQALYNQFLQQQAYPFQTAQFLANVAGGLGPLYGGQTFNAQAQPFFSDPRLKGGVRERADGGGLGYDGPEPIGQTYDGQDIWRYSKFGQPEIGLMAPQVQERMPDAVGEYGGYQTVDLPAATDDAAALGRARMGGAVEGPGDYARGGYAAGGAGLVSGDLASILAAHEAMYGGLGGGAGGYGPSGPAIGGGAGLTIPKEGIQAAQSIHRPGGAPSAMKSKSAEMLEGLGSAAGLGESAAKLYKLYKGEGKAAGGQVEEDGVAPKRLDLPTGEIASAKSIHEPSGGGGQSQKSGGLGGMLGDVASIGSSAATLGTFASQAAPYVKAGLTALAAFSDPRLKSGIRSGMADGGEPEGDIDRYLNALARGETGGQKDPYSTLGPQTKYGRAIGKYQVMPANVPQWSEEAGLGRMTPEQFTGNREAQETVARAKFGEYLKKTGSPEEAAAMWFGGPGYKKHAGAKDVLGTSIPEYQRRFRANAGLDGATPMNLRPGDRSFMASASDLPPEGATVDLRKGIGAAAPADEPRGISGFFRGTAPEGAGEKAMDFLTSERFLVPALTGLGAMASSPSRYLGSAILQGVGAGAGSYMDVMGKEADVAKREAETAREQQMTKTEAQETKKRTAEVAEKMQDVYGKSIFQRGDMWFVRLANGNTVSMFDWMKNPQPVWGGGAEGGAPAAPGSGAAGAPQRPIGVTPTGTVTPATGINYGPASTKSATEEQRALYTPGSANVKKQSADYIDQINQGAAAATAQRIYHNDIAKIIADASSATGAGVMGAGANWRSKIVNVLNTAARSAGVIGPDQQIFGDTDNQQKMLEKLAGLQAQAGVTGAGQKAFASLQTLIGTLPNLDQPPRAAAFNAASNLVTNQRRIDQQSHAQAYGQNSGELYYRAGSAFERDNGPAKYTAEQNALAKVMLDPGDIRKKRPSGAKVMEAMVSGAVTPAQIEEYFEKNYKLKGMSRYFTGAQ